MSGATTGRTSTGARRARHRYFMAVVVVAAVVIAACTPPPDDTAILQHVKQTVYGDLAAAEAPLVAAGTAHPIVEFTVENTPPSIFVNWIVPDAQAGDFASFIDLPPGFSLAKVSILESDPAPRYWLSLNVYKVSGITTGLRAEWSTYVDDGSGVPRFMIVRARAAQGSIDPIGPLAFPEPFDHTLGTDGVISTAMNQTELRFGRPVLTEDNLYNSTIELPDPASRQYVEPTLDWVAANDFIYWINGVRDRTFYNSSAHSAPLISIDPADVTLVDDSEWAQFLDPAPAHVLVYLDQIQFAIQPWWNVTEPDGLVDPATLASLFDFKKSLYGGFASTQAIQVRSGSVDPTVFSTVEDAPPSAYWHWEIPTANLAGLETLLDLRAGLSLAPVRLEDGDTSAAHWLTLHVYRESGPTSGLRAEWSTHVDDGEGIRTLTIEARADHPALDPTNVTSTTDPYTPASSLTHAVAGGSLDTAVGTGATSFTSSFAAPVGGGSTVLPAREFVGANDLRYWTNGVADRMFYGSAALDTKISVDPGTVSVTDGGQWAQFVDGGPDRVWVDRQAIELITSPWSIIPDADA